MLFSITLVFVFEEDMDMVPDRPLVYRQSGSLPCILCPKLVETYRINLFKEFVTVCLREDRHPSQKSIPPKTVHLGFSKSLAKSIQLGE